MNKEQLAQVEKLFSEVSKNIQCSICHKTVTESSVDLICNHIFCQTCFNKSTKRKCQVCQKDLKLKRNHAWHNPTIDNLGSTFLQFCNKIKTNHNVSLIPEPQDSDSDPDIISLTKPAEGKPRRTYTRKSKDLNSSNKENSFNALLDDLNVSQKRNRRSKEALAVNKLSVIEWLSSTKNRFDILTQTQQLVDDCLDVEGPSPSISQLPKVLLDGNRKRCKSLEVKIETLPDNVKRHTICTDIPVEQNYAMENVSTEELIKRAEAKVIENLIEDEYLDKLEAEMKEVGTNSSVSPSGWDRMKDINAKISRKSAKKLKVELNKGTASEAGRKRDESDKRIAVEQAMKSDNNVIRILLEEQYSPQDICASPDDNNLQRQIGTIHTILKKCIARLEKKKRLTASESLLLSDLKGCEKQVSQLQLPNEIINSTQKGIQRVSNTSEKGTSTSPNLTETGCQTAENETNQIDVPVISNKITTSQKSVQTCKTLVKSTQTSQNVKENGVQTIVYKTCEQHTQTNLQSLNKTVQTEVCKVTERKPQGSNDGWDVGNFSSQEIAALEAKLQDKPDILKISPITVPDFNRQKSTPNVLSSDSLDNYNINSQEIVTRALIHDEPQSKKPKSHKRPMVIDSDSEEGIPRKKACSKFLRTNLSIKFDSQESEEVDYDDCLDKIMKMYDNPPNEEVAEPPRNVDEEAKVSETSNVLLERLPSSGKLDDDNYFDENCLSKLDKDIEEFERSSKNINTDISDIIYETEQPEPPKKAKGRKPKGLGKNKLLQHDFKEVMDVKIEHKDNVATKINKDITHFNDDMDIEIQNNEISASDHEDDDDDEDVIECTPPHLPERNASQSLNTDDFAIALPPPAEFCDDPPPAEFCDDPPPVTPPNQSQPTSQALNTLNRKGSLPEINSRTSTPSSKDHKPDLPFSPIFSQIRNKLASQPLDTPKGKKGMLSSIPGQRSMFSYVQQSPSTSFSNVSQENLNSSIGSKPMVTATRLDKMQLLTISTLAHRKLVTFSPTYSESVTHLIANVDENNCVEEHTMKFILAVASGAWVLNYNWVKDSLAQNRLVPEAPYEVLDGTGIAGPKIARLSRLTRPLFKGFKFCCLPPFQSAVKDDVEKVIKLLDGKVVPDLNSMNNFGDGLHGIIVSEIVGTQDFEIYEKYLEKYRCITVDLEWISKSVAQYKLTSVRPFLLCSEDYLSQLRYPQELLEEVPLSGTEDDL
ncbi:uncharacterized protein LOC109604354 isoform X2 [Aethina tumida]|uniref:uncharacterized protein LOC109604354 isoform X2 n=1 Tax=Aethina tumida TaxID=116153 RepID=UPI002148D0AB|nr:uncharacterized protein LOC109604354 isoform X2 [Aethina tumida]